MITWKRFGGWLPSRCVWVRDVDGEEFLLKPGQRQPGFAMKVLSVSKNPKGFDDADGTHWMLVEDACLPQSDTHYIGFVSLADDLGGAASKRIIFEAVNGTFEAVAYAAE